MSHECVRREGPVGFWNRNAPAVGFVVLIAFLGVLLVAYEHGSALWCQSDERLAVCLRNWVNSAGNLFAFAAASAAAVFTFRQAIAARRQADFASLPAIEDRIAGLEDIQDAIHRVTTHCTSLSAALNGLLEYAAADDHVGARRCTIQVSRNSKSLASAIDILKSVGKSEKFKRDLVPLVDGINIYYIVVTDALDYIDVYYSTLRKTAGYVPNGNLDYLRNDGREYVVSAREALSDLKEEAIRSAESGLRLLTMFRILRDRIILSLEQDQIK